MAERNQPEPLVQTDWLEAHLGAPDLRIFDCTTHLRPAGPEAGVPYHPESGRAEYDQGHIPGAGFLDLQGELSDRGSRNFFMLPPEAQFSAAMARHGIGEGTRVVLYSAGSMMWSTRVWWMLHAFGFDHAAVLDGGFEKWRAEARPIDTAPSAYPPATFVARARPELVVDKSVVLRAIDDPGVCLINTLSEPDFRGDGPSRYGRPGRIPRSVNLPWPSLTDPETGGFIPLADAKARLDALGATSDRPILCYCGGGISATMALLQLHRLGYHNLQLYDASMGEWARDDTLPIERG